MSIIAQVFLLICAVVGVLIGLRLLLHADSHHPSALSRFTDLRNGVSCILFSLLILIVMILLGR